MERGVFKFTMETVENSNNLNFHLFPIYSLYLTVGHPSNLLNHVSPFPKRQILDTSKLKEFAENHFKLDENGREISKQVENTVGKGEGHLGKG